LVVVPARAASIRFPGKPLAILTNRNGVAKPLIEWTWDAAVRAVGRDATLVATDDHAIADCVRSFGGDVVMTSSSAENGTERCAETLSHFGALPELIVNLQGDSPLVPADHIDALIRRWQGTRADMVTAYVECDATTTDRLVADYRREIVGATTVVTRSTGEALYFSKAPLPARRDPTVPIKMHLGLYAYTPAALKAYATAPASSLERAEGLEQLRFLELGMSVQTVAVRLPEFGLWEVNNPDDVTVVEQALPL
jgi:3-deoxy-manno-octulosonate cytidylyltransferase (CMP-KDO synthetase)